MGDAATILVVEDDFDIAEAMRMSLEREGYEVAVAVNGRAALDRLALLPNPDAIVLDLMMPVMNGFEVLAELRRQEAWADIPVIVVSANEGYDRDDLGTFAVLRKPVLVDVLLACLKAAVFASQRASSSG